MLQATTDPHRFFNLFLVFTIGGSASKFWPTLLDGTKEPAKLSYELARSVKALGTFYTNFILLQGKLLTFNTAFR